MLILAHLKPLVEARSGAPPVQCDAPAFRARVGFDLDELRGRGYDPSVIEEHRAFNSRLADFFSHPVIGEYLGTMTPARSYQASGIWVGTLDDLRACIFPPDSTPESQLFPHGYIPVAGDGGGNSICFHLASGLVIFAHHERASDIIDGDVQVLSESIDAFLTDLLHDRLTERLDELD
jgi:hypothetical protein